MLDVVAPALGLNVIPAPPMSRFGMATILKKLLTLCLALAFVAGATAQLALPGMAQAGIGLRADMTAGPGEPGAPCPAHPPACIEQAGCLAVSAVTPCPASLPTAFRWTSVAFDAAAASLRGISIRPELSPPILAG